MGEYSEEKVTILEKPNTPNIVDTQLQSGGVKMEKTKEVAADNGKQHFITWDSYEPIGEIKGDLEVEYKNGEIMVFKNMKHLYDDEEESISFYYQLEMGAWAIIRIPYPQIADYKVIKDGS